MAQTQHVQLDEIHSFPTRIEHPEHGEILLVDWTRPHEYSQNEYFAYVVPGEDDGGLLRDPTVDVTIVEEPPKAND